MTGHHISPEQAATREWDVIIIGAGMGGAAAAYALAQSDLDILVLERGQATFEQTATIEQDTPDPAQRLALGRWPEKLRGVVDARQSDFWAPLGCGVGGSTLLYAAALDRLRPDDFAPQALPDGGEVAWPISYQTLEPFYAQAEALLEVSGTPDPLTPQMQYALAPPPPASERDDWFMAQFAKAGLHPYRLHAGQRNVAGCGACLGQVCLKDCKRHGGNAFLEPVFATGRISIATGVQVQRLVADETRVAAVEVHSDAGSQQIAARAVVLAAGAYFSPVLLQNSSNEHWPQGLANTHDQVGRNLMFHADRRMAIWGGKRLSRQGAKKSIALRDFYTLADGSKCGEMQSTGAEARYGNVLYVLRQQFDLSRFARWKLLRHLLRIPAMAADKLLGRATIFAVILEDFPYPDNRVLADSTAPSGMRFQYRVPEELHRRSKALTQAVSNALRGLRCIWLSQEPGLNHGHPCGTCRMGHDPHTSVVDSTGRAHGVENLYLACGSVLTTSGATNPSLTIAALGLRTGEALAKRLE